MSGWRDIITDDHSRRRKKKKIRTANEALPAGIFTKCSFEDSLGMCAFIVDSGYVGLSGVKGRLLRCQATIERACGYNFRNTGESCCFIGVNVTRQLAIGDTISDMRWKRSFQYIESNRDFKQMINNAK